jgi:bifunctional DNA-binding transcriptional regulator/antitoxin component of YhaV-PrlF toxin-antitoxin module
MATATVSEDGKVEIPDALLEQLGIAAGDKVDLSLNANGELVVRKAKKTWRDSEGILRRPGQRPVSIEEMNEGIGDAIAENYERFLRESKKQP